ncbi:MAG: hypothetical protein RL172_2636 [Bacteroidota bacterium]|jgi:tRNA threonylcarbamoyladenosine biosynthesis protein TsaB
MSLVLTIDTSLDTASVCIAHNGLLLCSKTNTQQKDHASFLEPAIKELLQQAGLVIQQLKAVAVVAGPGSYTGLRVGMSSAKALCFTLNIPLLLLNTLELMTRAVVEQLGASAAGHLFCPMIDARRMEVFTALYDENFVEKLRPTACILESNSFANELQHNPIYFFGNGAKKWESLCSDKNARFILLPDIKKIICASSAEKLASGSFADIAYADALYIKDFYTTIQG